MAQSTPFAGPYLNVNGLVYPLSGLMVFTASLVIAGGQSYTTLRQRGATSGYQVTSGKSLYLVAGILKGNKDAGTNGGINLLYGDNDVGLNGSAPTNVTSAFTGGTWAAGGALILQKDALAGIYPFDCIGSKIPSQKYAAIANFSNGTGIMLTTFFGYEA